MRLFFQIYKLIACAMFTLFLFLLVAVVVCGPVSVSYVPTPQHIELPARESTAEWVLRREALELENDSRIRGVAQTYDAQGDLGLGPER